jgi:hypothetical protein
VTRSFAWVLVESKREEKVCYSRHFIQSSLPHLHIDSDRCAEFSLIAFEQISRLLRLTAY